HNLPVGRSEADRSAGLIKEEYETQAGRTAAPTAPSPVAGTVELVKPLRAQWPSSDERLTVPSDSIVCCLSANHGQKRELGGVTRACLPRLEPWPTSLKVHS